MSAPGPELVYREFGSPMPYGDMRVYIEVQDSAQRVIIKRSKTAMKDTETWESDLQTVTSYVNDPLSAARLQWIDTESPSNQLEDVVTIPVDRSANTPLTRLIKGTERSRGYVAATMPIQPRDTVAPLGFAILSQIRWLGDKDIVLRMLVIASSAFVLIVLMDGGARKRRTGASFGNVEFIRSFYWAGVIGGLVITATAVRIAFAETTYPSGTTAFRIVDSLVE